MDTYLRVLVFVTVGWLALVLMICGSRLRGNAVGNPPIAWPALALAKLGLAVPFVLLIRYAAQGSSPISVWMALGAAGLLIGGCAIVTAGLLALGTNLRMGLPQPATSLVTSGIYRFSRNPIYFGIYLYLGASLVVALSWLNFCAVLAAVVLHHWIILAEEHFLEEKFRDYEKYRRCVRRYF